MKKNLLLLVACFIVAVISVYNPSSLVPTREINEFQTGTTTYDKLYVLATSYDVNMGQDKALLYFRSSDGGDIWDVPGIILDEDHNYQENRIIVAKVPKSTIGIDEKTSDLDIRMENYPNPFSESTTVTVTIPCDGNVSLAVRDTYGRQIAEISHGFLNKGTHQFRIDRQGLPDGIYFYTLKVDNKSFTRKMIVI